MAGAAADVCDPRAAGEPVGEAVDERHDSRQQLPVEQPAGHAVHHRGELRTELLVRHAATVAKGVRNGGDVPGEQCGRAGQRGKVARAGTGEAHRAVAR